MRLNRGTIALLIIGLIVIVGALALQKPLQSLLSPPTMTPAVRNLLPTDLAQTAQEFRVQVGEDFTEMQVIDGLWQVTDGTAIDPEQETHHDLILGILQLMSEFEYASTFIAENLGQYGLDDPSATIRITTTDETIDLSVGATNPDGNRYYVMLGEEPQVYLSPAVFEINNIMRLATLPPYRQVLPEVTDEPSENILFPDIFGYQIATFEIRDGRDGSFIKYTQGDQGTWALEGTVVNPSREVNHVAAAVNVSIFLFLEVEKLPEQVIESAKNDPLLTITMTTFDEETRTLFVVEPIENTGYLAVLDDDPRALILPIDTVNRFFDMVRQPPYAQ